MRHFTTRSYISFVLRHRLLVCIVAAVISVGSAYTIISDGVIASSMLKMFFGENSEYNDYRELAAQFGDNDLTIAAYRDPHLLTSDGWQRLVRITEALEELPYVKRIDSLSNAERVINEDDTLIVEGYDEFIERTNDYKTLAKEINSDAIIAGQLITKDGSATALLLEFLPDEGRAIETVPVIMAEIRQVFLDAGIADTNIHMAGILPETVEAINQAYFSLERVFPATAIILVIVVYILFGQLWPVLITGGIALIAILWTFGFAILLDPQVNVMLATVPTVMMVVAFSDIIHLCSAYLQELALGHNKKEAILLSGAEVGRACFYTSITTFCGFISLAFVPTPIFKQLGFVLGFGVAIALFLAMTLVPILFTLLPTPKYPERQLHSPAGIFVDRITNGCLRIATHFPKRVVALFAAVTVMALWGVTLLKVETNIVERMSEDNRARIAHTFINNHFNGTAFIDAYLQLPAPSNAPLVKRNPSDKQVPQDFLDPQLFAKVIAFQRQVEALPTIDQARSVVDLVERIHHELADSPPKTHYNRATLAQYLLLFEISGGEQLERLIDMKRRTLRIGLRLHSKGLVSLADVAKQVTAIGKQVFGTDANAVKVWPTGIGVLLGEWIQFIITGQKTGLIFAIVGTALLMILCLGLWRVGLMTMIPNLFPLIILGGYIGWFWDAADSDTMIVAIIAIGIAVDDTIHFMSRLRCEVARQPTLQLALQRTFDFTGRGIVKTTIILCAGFSPCLFSDYFSIKIMGGLLPMALITALLADLLLLPALIQLNVIDVSGYRSNDKEPA